MANCGQVLGGGWEGWREPGAAARLKLDQGPRGRWEPGAEMQDALSTCFLQHCALWNQVVHTDWMCPVIPENTVLLWNSCQAKKPKMLCRSKILLLYSLWGYSNSSFRSDSVFVSEVFYFKEGQINACWLQINAADFLLIHYEMK